MKKRIIILSILSTLVFNASFSQKITPSKAIKKYDKLSYVESKKQLLELVNKGDRSFDVIEKLANAYYFNGEMVEAAKWYKNLIDSDIKVNSENYFRYAQSLKAQEKYEEANNAMNKFAGLKPNDSRALAFIENQNYTNIINENSGNFELVNLDINTEFSDFGTSTYNSNLFFASSRDLEEKIYSWNEQPFLDLFELNTEGGVTKMAGAVNTKYHESSTSFTKDGKTVYFTRNNFYKGKFKKNKDDTHVLKVYKARLVDSVWTNIIPLPFNNDDYSVAHPALNVDGSKLYFASDMPGTRGASDIFVVDINKDGTYGKPVNLGNKINTEGRENFPYVSEKGILYFSSDGHNGLGGLDVFNIEIDKINDDETLIKNLGKPINSSKDDFGFIINEESGKGYISSNRAGGKGDDDIYSFQIPNCAQVVTGTVKDNRTLALLPGAVVTLYNEEDIKLQSVTVGDDATYMFESLECEKEYSIKVEQGDYFLAEIAFITPDKTQKLFEELVMKKDVAEVGTDLFKSLNLGPILFDYDKSFIRPDAKIELAKIINYMKEFPDVKVDVRSHTDSRGRDAYNLALSKKRNRTTLDYMINNGKIAKDRLSGKGYGETHLKNHCSNGVECTKAEHQANRRSEFIVVDN